MLPAVADEKFAINAIIVNTTILIAFSLLPVAVNMGFPILYDILIIPVSAYLMSRVLLLKFRRGMQLPSLSLRAFLASNYYLSAFLILLIVGALIRFL